MLQGMFDLTQNCEKFEITCVKAFLVNRRMEHNYILECPGKENFSSQISTAVKIDKINANKTD